jgi:hypothetical protein
LPGNTVLQSAVIIRNYIRYGSKYQGQEYCNFIAGMFYNALGPPEKQKRSIEESLSKATRLFQLPLQLQAVFLL